MDVALRDQLVRMAEADRQALTAFLSDADRHRQAFEEGQPTTATPWPYALLEWSPEDQAPPSVQQVLAVVRTNTASLRVIVHERGWPGRSVVGEDGADAAWLVLQHAGSGVVSIGTPENHEFRRACVPLLEHAVQEGEAHPRHLAWTVDGIRSVAGEPPVFAVLTTDYTIEDGEPRFRCPIDVTAIERRRAEIGLPTLRSDVARRARGEQLFAEGIERAEPWPDPASH